jgi:hypothetical protein
MSPRRPRPPSLAQVRECRVSAHDISYALCPWALIIRAGDIPSSARTTYQVADREQGPAEPVAGQTPEPAHRALMLQITAFIEGHLSSSIASRSPPLALSATAPPRSSTRSSRWPGTRRPTRWPGPCSSWPATKAPSSPAPPWRSTAACRSEPSPEPAGGDFAARRLFPRNRGPGSRGYPDAQATARAPLMQAPLPYPVNPGRSEPGSPPIRRPTVPIYTDRRYISQGRGAYYLRR